MRLKGKVAVVTGAAQGIGRACAERLAAEGAAVMVSDVQSTKVVDVAAQIVRSGGRAQGMACDVADARQIEGLVTAAIEAFGAIDIAVSNAGVIDSADFLDLSLADFDRVLSVNLRAGFVFTQAAARQMVHQVKAGRAPGAIINMSSANAHFGLPDHVAYSISKGGLGQLTKASAISLAKYGIRVNAVGPGTINTEIVKAVADNPAALSKILSRTPLGRFGEPSEVASIVAFLASDDASYITGQTIFPDGGRMFLNYTVDVPHSQ
ncbi:MAG: SDR family oxidoreductase [Hyphomicrobiaceae bacterium]|nr:SDR family oxidoreductase [Hyphomicrobiaceae bacterium]